MATHCSTLAWKIPWTEEPGRLQSVGSQRVDTTERLHRSRSMQKVMISQRLFQGGRGNSLGKYHVGS